ncbi:hypothetical protein AAD001_15545 [Colwelliaceae bacterium 6471]
MKTTILTWLLLSFTFLYGDAFAQDKCQAELNKLENIKSQQRQGNSLKKSNSLRKQEERSRKKWWQCKNNVRPHKTKRSLKKNRQVAKKAPLTKIKNAKPTSPNKQKLKPITYHALTITAPFTGERQQQWLRYYKMPEQCYRPKTTQVFAYCAENKQAQQREFEQLNDVGELAN